MKLSKSQRAILFVAKGRLGIGEEVWRTILAEVAGVSSVTELDHDGFTAIMGLFEYMGWEPTTPRGPNYGDRAGMATYAQLALIRALWHEWSDSTGSDGLNTWLERTFKVSSLRFLTGGQARGAITALKAMKARKQAA